MAHEIKGKMITGGKETSWNEQLPNIKYFSTSTVMWITLNKCYL